jgi:hypothetical protein
MPGDKKYFVGESLREKLRATVAKVDATPQGGDRTRIPTVVGGGAPAFAQKVFRMATFTGTWNINEAKTVTFRGVTATPNTVSVQNLVCGLSPSGACDISIAKDGTAWYLVQPNLTQQPGYSASGTQVLSIVNGNLTWIGTTACA